MSEADARFPPGEGPWGAPAPAEPPPAVSAPRRGAISRFVVGLLSTALLAALIAMQWGWIWALAGVFSVLVHECGHLVLINALGCGPGELRIIPFFGGVATLKRTPRTEFQGVAIALAGPIAGLLASAPFLIATAWTGDARWAGGAFFIALINLTNLAPAPPLDGAKALGPVLAFVHPALERVALALVGVAAVAWAFGRGSLLFGAFIAIATLGALRGRRMRPPAEKLSLAQWTASLGLWTATLLLGLLVLQLSVGGAGLAPILQALHRAGLQ